VAVEPFVLSDRVRVTAALPADASLRRLHVLLTEVATGTVVGRGSLDVIPD
jgi:hypothetical protein